MARSGIEAVAALGEARGADVAYLDQALWRCLAEATELREFAAAWLTLQCGLIAGCRRGVLVLVDEDGQYQPVARFPEAEPVTPALSRVAERVLRERKGLARADKEPASDSLNSSIEIAHPIFVDEVLSGVVALELEPQDRRQLGSVMRQVQWGCAWVSSWCTKQGLNQERGIRARLQTTLQCTAQFFQHESFDSACKALVTDLSARFECQRVSIGFIRRHQARISAVSHAAHFDKRMGLLRLIGEAMDEAIDRAAVVIHPQPAGEPRRAPASAALSRETGGSVMGVPLIVRDRPIGALIFEFEPQRPITQEMVDVCLAIGSFVGPIIEDKRSVDDPVIALAARKMRVGISSLLGPDHLGRKLLALAVLVVAGVLSVADATYRVTAHLRLEGVVQRAIAAPLDGFVRTGPARAGDLVKKDQTLATLDDRDTRLERARSISVHRQHLKEYDDALAKGDRRALNVIRTQIEQAVAQIELLDVQIERTVLSAPFDGIVVSGDLSQRIGGAVQRGEILFEIAPLNEYRVILEVDEREIADVRLGQRGEMAVSSIPDHSIPLVVDHVTPVTQQRDGRNYFRVEAKPLDAESVARLRPGMAGVAKVDVEPRRLIWIWTYKIVDWLRLMIWRWWP